MKTVAERWTEFSAVIHPDAHASQRQEMRRAFYAGFQSALSAGIQMADESGANDDVGATMIQRLWDECRGFMTDVKEGRA